MQGFTEAPDRPGTGVNAKGQRVAAAPVEGEAVPAAAEGTVEVDSTQEDAGGVAGNTPEGGAENVSPGGEAVDAAPGGATVADAEGDDEESDEDTGSEDTPG